MVSLKKDLELSIMYTRNYVLYYTQGACNKQYTELAKYSCWSLSHCVRLTDPGPQTVDIL